MGKAVKGEKAPEARVELPPLKIPEMLEACLSSPTAENLRSSHTVNVVDGLFAIAHALNALAVHVQGTNELLSRIEQRHKTRGILLS